MIQLIFELGFALGSSLFGMLVKTFNDQTAWLVVLGAVIIAYSLELLTISSMNKLNKSKSDENSEATETIVA